MTRIFTPSRVSRGKKKMDNYFNSLGKMSSDSDLTTSILAKWRDQKRFVRFINKDKLDNRAENLEICSLHDAIAHFNDWIVDWDINLSPKEIELVRKAEWRAGLRFGESTKTKTKPKPTKEKKRKNNK